MYLTPTSIHLYNLADGCCTPKWEGRISMVELRTGLVDIIGVIGWRSSLGTA
jgi:hypothetical protein